MIEPDKLLLSLFKMYPNAHCELNYSSPFELLVATVLSAQTTDVKVNQVTKRMFKKWNTPEDFSNLPQDELEKEIKEIGLYKNKSKNIISLSKAILNNYDGKVPMSIEELMQLNGVGKKTANVVVSNAFGVPTIAVDTHVFRVSNRIGLADAKNVEETEMQLMSIIPKQYWIQAHHTLIFHGRRMCTARNPKCGNCIIKENCKYYNTIE